MAKCERKVMTASLHVDPLNIAAKTLYESMDFKHDGVLEDYYAPGRAALKMRYDLV